MPQEAFEEEIREFVGGPLCGEKKFVDVRAKYFRIPGHRGVYQRHETAYNPNKMWWTEAKTSR